MRALSCIFSVWSAVVNYSSDSLVLWTCLLWHAHVLCYCPVLCTLTFSLSSWPTVILMHCARNSNSNIHSDRCSVLTLAMLVFCLLSRYDLCWRPVLGVFVSELVVLKYMDKCFWVTNTLAALFFSRLLLCGMLMFSFFAVIVYFSTLCTLTEARTWSMCYVVYLYISQFHIEMEQQDATISLTCASDMTDVLINLPCIETENDGNSNLSEKNLISKRNPKQLVGRMYWAGRLKLDMKKWYASNLEKWVAAGWQNEFDSLCQRITNGSWLLRRNY